MLFLQFLLNLLVIKQSADLIESQFEHFIDKYERPYKTDPDEYGKRMQIFQNSLNQIDFLNSLRTHEQSAFFGITKYSDLSTEEFLEQIAKNKRTKSNQKRKPRNRDFFQSNVDDVPDKFDWRDKNVVSAVRNQGKCGACWAHSTVATVESMVAIKTNKLREFSVQQLVDCSKGENQGCTGGDTCSALIWLDQNNITLESADLYPNKDHSEDCKSKKESLGVRIRSNFTCDSFVNKEQKIVQLLAKHGPLIAAVDASTWQHYLGGIIQYHCFNDLNHAVQITGYDLTGNIPFYKVRNTWDVGFGVNGYIHIEIGGNLCGIAEEISAIDVKDIPEHFY